jgi:ketosteroid isomerase-like protein
MPANLDLVRSIFADWERGDFARVDWADPNIEYVVVDGPSPGSVTGLSRMAAANRDFLEAWDDVRIEASDYRVVDDQRVLAIGAQSGRGRASGVRLDAIGAILFQLRDGRVCRVSIYWDRERALAEVGLDE